MEDQKNQYSYQAEQPQYSGGPAGYPVDYKESPVTVKQWLLFWLVTFVNLIPVLGWLCYVIFILYVAFKKDPRFPVAMQNFCKAYLIVIAIGLALAFVFAGSIIAMALSLSGMNF